MATPSFISFPGGEQGCGPHRPESDVRLRAVDTLLLPVGGLVGEIDAVLEGADGNVGSSTEIIRGSLERRSTPGAAGT